MAPNLMTPVCGRGHLAQPIKKRWTKPEIRQFETPEEIQTHDSKASGTERDNLTEFVEQFQRIRRTGEGCDQRSKSESK